MIDDAAAAESRRLVCAVTVGYRGGGRHLARAARTGPGQLFPLRTLHCGATCFETQPTLAPWTLAPKQAAIVYGFRTDTR